MSPHAGQMLVNEVAPRIYSAARHSVSPVGCEDAQEIAQDAIALAARMLHGAEASGKTVTPGNIAYYALQCAKSGRRSVGHSNADALGTATQLNGRSQVRSMQMPLPPPDEAADDYCFDQLFEREQDDPARRAARKLDWEAFCHDLGERARAILSCLAEGGSLRSVARRFGVSDSAIQEQKNRIAAGIRAFMGEDVLALVMQPPAWQSSLVAQRERQVVRAFRN